LKEQLQKFQNELEVSHSVWPDSIDGGDSRGLEFGSEKKSRLLSSNLDTQNQENP